MTDTAPLAERLLAWWRKHGRHDLPWQHPRTPYRVWISEVMLQQTQVATVIPYFERWMQSFPDLATLAAAPEDAVLAHWSGLGYYARARNLHDTARECVERFDSELPADPEVLASLPGIGRSTANAIVSQAHDVPLPILDGNAKRVLARHAAIAGWPGQSAVARTLWREAEKRLPRSQGADYSQAIMDLGATLCTVRDPACPDCPVREDCRALAENAVDQYPGRKPTTKVQERTLYMLLLRDPQGRVLLERRPPAGIWGGLWSLPEDEDADSLTQRMGLDPNSCSELPTINHRLSHQALTIHPRLALAEVNSIAEGPGQAWFSAGQWPGLGLPRPVAKLLEQLQGPGQPPRSG